MIKHRGLILLRAGQAPTTGELPTRLKLLPWGTSETRFGKITVGPVTLAALPGNQRKLKFDHVALDYQHGSVQGTKFYQGEPVTLAARSAVPEVVEGEGLFVKDIDWLATPDQARNYRDLSAAVKTDADGNVIFLHSAALARQGEVDDIVLPLSADPFNSTGDNSMDFKKLLCAILDIDPDNATDTEIEAAANKLADKSDASAPSDAKTLAAVVEKALKPLSAEIALLKGADTLRERDQIIALAARDGKEIPAAVLPDKDGKGGLDNAALKLFCAGLPVTVPLERRTAANVLPLAAVVTGLPSAGTAEETIRKQMGISKERWDKKD